MGTNPRRQRNNGGSGANGRMTSAQLAKMRELVGELNRDWGNYRQHVRDQHGVNIEYADRKLASSLIKSLMASVRKARGNGSEARVS